MIYNLDQIKTIIKTNPNKDLITKGKEMCEKLSLHLHGRGLDKALKRYEHFENDDIYKERQKGTISNKDLFGRVLQSEDMIFTAHGGMTLYDGLNTNQTAEFTQILDSIKFGYSLRKWIQRIALDAYRCDPMGVIMIEIKDEKCYPIYQCSENIYDYLPNGRQLEYLCLQLTVKTAIEFGISDIDFNNIQNKNSLSKYFRFIDDSKDYIFKLDNEEVSEYENDKVKTLPIIWGKTPAFIISDIIANDDSHKFLSPLDLCVELADCYLYDRSIRDLQKKYSGFAKTIEPLLQCGTCDGTGFLAGAACPDCTPMGADRGTGYKLKTKVADVARFPISSLAEGFDFNRIFGYVKPSIETWDKQDFSLQDLENLIKDVYWGTDNRAQTSGPDKNSTPEETATKTVMNLQPKYARLNQTADWAENTENTIINFLGAFYFDSFKKSHNTYGRFYILETPNELMDKYLNMKNLGANQYSLTEALKRYYYAVYSTNPIKQAIAIKMINIEPFVHNTILEIQPLGAIQQDYLSKLYFNEWIATIDDNYLLINNIDKLKKDLLTFVSTKKIENDQTSNTGTQSSPNNNAQGQ